MNNPLLQHRTEHVGHLRFIWLELTSKCNLECTHCYAQSGPHESLLGSMGISDWMNVMDESFALGARGIQFIGGEPTLHPHFRTLLRYASDKGFEDIEVYTNATRIDNGLISCLKKYNTRVATSFYGDTPDIHDLVTTRIGSWRRTIVGIKKIIDANIPLRIGIVETPNNVGATERTRHFLENMGATDIRIDGQRGVGRANKNNLQDFEEDFSQLCGQCWKGNACITSDGSIFPCVFSRKTLLGNAMHGIEHALTSAQYGRFSETQKSTQVMRSEQVCYPNLPCSPQVCEPQLNCAPNRFCHPDDQCRPHSGYQTKERILTDIG